MKGKVIVVLALMALCAGSCNSSAIPMWEFLKKEEKVRILRHLKCDKKSFKKQFCA
jgi:hypothetical protein